jgi:hypothetical protein
LQGALEVVDHVLSGAAVFSQGKVYPEVEPASEVGAVVDDCGFFAVGDRYGRGAVRVVVVDGDEILEQALAGLVLTVEDDSLVGDPHGARVDRCRRRTTLHVVAFGRPDSVTDRPATDLSDGNGDARGPAGEMAAPAPLFDEAGCSHLGEDSLAGLQGYFDGAEAVKGLSQLQQVGTAVAPRRPLGRRLLKLLLGLPILLFGLF